MVSQEHLQDKVKNEKGVIRIGITKRDINERKQEYERGNYSGEMFYAKTTNMRLAENKLFGLAIENDAGRHNKQKDSNAAEEAGYVYIIQGRRYN